MPGDSSSERRSVGSPPSPPPSPRGGESFSLDEIMDARAQRSIVWRKACTGEITTAQAYEALDALRKQFGEWLYGGSRIPRQRDMFR